MKKWWKVLDIIYILMLVATLTFAGCCGCTNYKYVISQGDQTYLTLDYTKDSNGCLNFKTINDGNDVTICGTYSIEVNKNYKPAKSDNSKFRH